MSAHVLSNVLNKSGKIVKCKVCRAFYLYVSLFLMLSANFFIINIF